MSLRPRNLAATLLMTALTLLGGRGARAADSSPQGVLEARGLVRSGTTFSLAEDAEIARAIQGLAPTVEVLKKEFAEHRDAETVEERFRAANAMVSDLSSRIEIAQRYLNGLPGNPKGRAERLRTQHQLEELRNMLSQARAELNTVGPLRVPSRRKEELKNNYYASNADFYAKVQEIYALTTSTAARYKELNQDSSLRAALNAIERSEKINAKIGPTTSIERAVNQLREIQRKYPPLDANTPGLARTRAANRRGRPQPSDFEESSPRPIAGRRPAAEPSPTVDLADLSRRVVSIRDLLEDIRFQDRRGLQRNLTEMRTRLNQLSEMMAGAAEVEGSARQSHLRTISDRLGAIRADLGKIAEDQRQATPNRPHVKRLDDALTQWDLIIASFQEKTGLTVATRKS